MLQIKDRSFSQSDFSQEYIYFCSWGGRAGGEGDVASSSQQFSALSLHSIWNCIAEDTQHTAGLTRRIQLKASKEERRERGRARASDRAGVLGAGFTGNRRRQSRGRAPLALREPEQVLRGFSADKTSTFNFCVCVWVGLFCFVFFLKKNRSQNKTELQNPKVAACTLFIKT